MFVITLRLKMAIDGETLNEYNYRVGLVGPSMTRSEKMNKLDDKMGRKKEYPQTAIDLLNEVADRRRLFTSKREAVEGKNGENVELGR